MACHHMDQNIWFSQKDEKGEERIFEEIMVKDFQNLMKDMNINTKGGQWTLSKMNSDSHTENQNFEN